MPVITSIIPWNWLTGNKNGWRGIGSTSGSTGEHDDWATGDSITTPDTSGRGFSGSDGRVFSGGDRQVFAGSDGRVFSGNDGRVFSGSVALGASFCNVCSDTDIVVDLSSSFMYS